MKNNGIDVKQVIIASFLMLLTPRAAVAQMNPYQIGMQYCQMVQNGVSSKKAWDYVISSDRKSVGRERV